MHSFAFKKKPKNSIKNRYLTCWSHEKTPSSSTSASMVLTNPIKEVFIMVFLIFTPIIPSNPQVLSCWPLLAGSKSTNPSVPASPATTSSLGRLLGISRHSSLLFFPSCWERIMELASFTALPPRRKNTLMPVWIITFSTLLLLLFSKINFLSSDSS